jgi:hypothetical protein
LAYELLSSSMALIAGGVHRLPHLHMARNTGPSITSKEWHPHQFLATDPTSLFREYAAYRAVVLEHLLADNRCRERYMPAQMERILDLVHLKYLAPMISGPVLDYIIDRSLQPQSGDESREIIAEAWSKFITPGGSKPEGLKGLLAQGRRALSDPQRAGRLLRHAGRLLRLRGALQLKENLDVLMDRRFGNLRIRRQTREKRPRSYLLSHEFLTKNLGGGRRISTAAVRNMIEQLDDYV